MELSGNLETQKEKYRDFRDALEDSRLDDDEKAGLKEQYYSDCEDLKNETSNACEQLQKEMTDFLEIKEMQRDEIRTLQIASGLNGAEVDGLRGPTTYAMYMHIGEKYPFFEELSPREIVKNFLVRIEEKFNSIDDKKSRQDIQRAVGSYPDGVFGPKTLAKILQRFEKVRDIFMVENETNVEGEDEDTSKIEENSSLVHNENVGEEENTQEKESLVRDVPEEVSGEESEEQMNVDAGIETKKSIEEIKADLIKESKSYPRGLIYNLQVSLKGISVDGAFGPQSASRVMEKYPDIQSLEEVFVREGIRTDVDGVLSSDGDPEVFRSLYGDYIEKLGDDLGLPQGFIEAIIKKETTYGYDLNSNTGSKGLMQLTKWPFKDMRGDIGKQIGVDPEKVLRYQNIFKKIDLDTLLSIEVGEKGEAKSRIPDNIVEALYTVQNSESIQEIQNNITLLRHYIKDDPYSYDHQVNMIIGSVYLSYLYDRADGDIWRAARDYNGDKKIGSNGKQTKINYANTVKRYFSNLQ